MCNITNKIMFNKGGKRVNEWYTIVNSYTPYQICLKYEWKRFVNKTVVLTLIVTVTSSVIITL